MSSITLRLARHALEMPQANLDIARPLMLDTLAEEGGSNPALRGHRGDTLRFSGPA